MATYLNGVSDYIPQAQPFKPDFNFYSNALSFRQAKQDAGYEQLNTLYSSMLNGPMSRNDNKDEREKFFKTIKGDIQKMAGLDLSKEQNVAAAGNVFNQLLDNDYIAKDMAWTRNTQNQQKRGQALKNCLDPKKCGGQWWEGGDRQLQYKTLEFQNMSRDKTLGARNVQYTSFQNVQERAIELADKMDLNVSSIVKDDGRWIITQTNGTLIQGDLYRMFVSTLGQDPKIKEYNTAKAYNNRMNYATSNMQEFGSLDAANSDYLSKMQQSIIGTTTTEELKDEKKALTSSAILKEKEAEASKEPKGFSPGMGELIGRLKQANAIDTRNREVSKNNSKMANNMSIAPNLDIKLSMMDELIGSSLFKADMQTAAITLSKRNASIEKKANPYGLANYKSQLRLKEMAIKAKMDKKAADEESGKGKKLGFGQTASNNLSGGKALDIDNKGNQFDKVSRLANQVLGKVNSIEKESIKEYNEAVYNRAAEGNVEAQNQLVKLGNTWMKHISGTQNRSTPGKQDLGDKDINYWLEHPMDFDTMELDSEFFSDAYNNVVTPNVELHKKNNSENSYLKDFQKNNRKRDNAINANLKMYDKFAVNTKKVMKQIRQDIIKSGDINVEAFDMVFDEYGAKRSREDFMKEYMDKDRLDALVQDSYGFGDGRGFYKNLNSDLEPKRGFFEDDEKYREHENPNLVGRPEFDNLPYWKRNAYNDLIDELTSEADEFYDGNNNGENLKFREDDNNTDFDQVDMQDILDARETLYRKYDKSAANKMFDVGDDAFIPYLTSGVVDSAQKETEAYKEVDSFMTEAFMNSATNIFIPEYDDGFLTKDSQKSSALAETYVKDLLVNIQNDTQKTSAKTRVKFSFEYSPMLDGNENTQYILVRPSLDYMKGSTGTNDSKMLDIDEMKKIAENGIVISYPTANSTTNLYTKSQQTASEYMLEHDDYFKIDDDQQYMDVNITRDSSGGLMSNGRILTGVDVETGEKNYKLLNEHYPKGLRLDDIIAKYNEDRLPKIIASYQKSVVDRDNYLKTLQ